jgi:hypothetical protein
MHGKKKFALKIKIRRRSCSGTAKAQYNIAYLYRNRVSGVAGSLKGQ